MNARIMPLTLNPSPHLMGRGRQDSSPRRAETKQLLTPTSVGPKPPNRGSWLSRNDTGLEPLDGRLTGDFKTGLVLVCLESEQGRPLLKGLNKKNFPNDSAK